MYRVSIHPNELDAMADELEKLRQQRDELLALISLYWEGVAFSFRLGGNEQVATRIREAIDEMSAAIARAHSANQGE